jgi:hypothetical protein
MATPTRSGRHQHTIHHFPAGRNVADLGMRRYTKISSRPWLSATKQMVGTPLGPTSHAS